MVMSKFRETIQAIYLYHTYVRAQKYKNTLLNTFITNNQ